MIAQGALYNHVDSLKNMEYRDTILYIMRHQLGFTSRPYSDDSSASRIQDRLISNKAVKDILDSVASELIHIIESNKRTKMEQRKKEQQKERQKQKQERQMNADGTKSVFMESLSGEMLSDDQVHPAFASDYSGSDLDEMAEMGPPKKKNRMGQRARRE